MFQSTRERLALLLLGLLPFHALVVTVGTKLIAGPGFAPMTALSIWKEILLLAIVSLALLEAVKWKVESGKWKVSFDGIDMLIVALLILAFLVSAYNFQLLTLNSQLFYGFKYDFIPFIAFLVLRRVAWGENFLDRACTVILIAAGIVCAYGILSWYLPQSFFSLLGYSDLHSLYTPDGPLAAFQQIGGTAIRRMQSTMSGPNQLGLWLLLPLGILLGNRLNRKAIGNWQLAIGLFVVVAMLMTLSRSALLAAAVMVGVTLWKQLPRKKLYLYAGVLFCASFVLAIASYFLVPDIIVRSASTSDHISRPLEALRIIQEHPFGLGLGTAGPASNRVSNTCVYLEEGADALWAKDRPNLCVFVGENQVQPTEECSCPLLPENWYLQIGVELGVLGLILYVMLVFLVLNTLRVTSYELRVTYLAFLGISIAALFLHAWEEAAVAYSLWILVSMCLNHQD